MRLFQLYNAARGLNSETRNKEHEIRLISGLHRASLLLLTPWSRVLLEKLTGSAASQEITAFSEPEGSSPYPQVPATFY